MHTYGIEISASSWGKTCKIVKSCIKLHILLQIILLIICEHFYILETDDDFALRRTMNTTYFVLAEFCESLEISQKHYTHHNFLSN